MQHLETKSAFARRALKTPGAITRALSGPLKAALVGKKIDCGHAAAIAYLKKDDSKEMVPGIDERYEEALLWMQTTGKWGAKTMTNAIEGLSDHRGRKICAQIKLAGLWESPLPAEPKKPRGQAVVKARKKEAPPVESDELPEHPSEYADKTLRWIVSKFSTDARFVDYLKALKEAEATEERMLKNAERRGDLVHRKVVTQGVLEHIDILFKQLLTDCSRTIATRAKAKVEAGESVEELELWVSKQIVGFIQPAKSKIQRTLRANKIE